MANDGATPVDLDTRIQDLDTRIGRLSEYIDAHQDLDAREMIALLQLHGQLTSRLGRLLRDRESLAGQGNQALDDAINSALDELSRQWGIDL